MEKVIIPVGALFSSLGVARYSGYFGSGMTGGGIRKPIGKLKHIYYQPTEKNEVAKKIAALPVPSLKLQAKSLETCGSCGGSQNLLVHDADPKDITCNDCYENNQSTSCGRYHGGQVMHAIEDSAAHKHHNQNVQHNKELVESLDTTKPSRFDKFLASAPDHIKKEQWNKMYSKGYVQHDKAYGPKDLDRLTYLLGAKHHEPERLTLAHKANLIGLGIKHMHSFSDVNSYKLPIGAFKDFNDLKGGLVAHPRIFEHITI